MTIEEFQKRYHSYRTTDAMEAFSDALKLRVVDSEGNKRQIVPMQFGNEWCLMLDTAASMARSLGLDSLGEE